MTIPSAILLFQISEDGHGPRRKISSMIRRDASQTMKRKKKRLWSDCGDVSIELILQPNGEVKIRPSSIEKNLPSDRLTPRNQTLPTTRKTEGSLPYLRIVLLKERSMHSSTQIHTHGYRSSTKHSQRSMTHLDSSPSVTSWSRTKYL